MQVPAYEWGVGVVGVVEALGESADTPDDEVADFSVGFGVERGERGFQCEEGGGREGTTRGWGMS